MDSSDSELSESDVELQEAFAKGKLKPGLNIVEQTQKKTVNNVEVLNRKLKEMYLNLPWIERLDCINAQAPLAPELAAQLISHKQQRDNQLNNNKKLPQPEASEDPILNDFKREMEFHRQAQAAVLYAIPKLKSLGFSTKRPEDYFAEMVKTDEHMQKIRKHLMVKLQQQQRSERVKQLRQQRREMKVVQVQTKLQRQQEKKDVLDQVKKHRKGISKDLDFLDTKKNKPIGRKALRRRDMKNKKFGFGGKKKGKKLNTKESAGDISDYRRPKAGNKGKQKNNRPGKNKRMKAKNRN